jgi:DNA-binding MarR family transcriptional regulator
MRRESSTTDRRAQMLFLTPEGERLASEATRRIVDAEAKALAVLSAGERAILVELLHKVACSRFDAR